MLDSMSAWGVSGSLMTLMPDQPLPQLEAPPALPSPPGPSPDYHPSSGPSLTPGAVAGIVVGSIAGAALLLGGVVLLLLRKRCGGWEGGREGGEGCQLQLGCNEHCRGKRAWRHRFVGAWRHRFAGE